jgi:hypothetical protein
MLLKLLGFVRKAMKGEIMSHSTNATMNKNQKQPKNPFAQYLYNSDEPADYESHDTPADLEAELLDSSFFLRRRIRRTADRIRRLSI